MAALGLSSKSGQAQTIQTECRDFVTSKQSLEGVTRFNGVACPADGSWKLNGSGLH
ncbi:RT0821/Lpp0805 family surface protein (plasmid) [Rhizobium leguminosarum]